MDKKGVWFSYNGRVWDKERMVEGCGRFHWTDEKKVWDRENCSIKTALKDSELLVVVRSEEEIESTFRAEKSEDFKLVDIRSMLGVVVGAVGKPVEEKNYTAYKNEKEEEVGPKDRWVFSLTGPWEKEDIIDRVWIWEWAKVGGNIKSSEIYKLYEKIKNELSKTARKREDLPANECRRFTVEGVHPLKSEIVPVIYQPAVDSMKNFLREVHCAKQDIGPDGSRNIEVTLLFNNEKLRKNCEKDQLYAKFRRWMYGRTQDVETFHILVDKDQSPNHFVFKNIYSTDCKGPHDIKDDDVHGEPKNPERHMIKYCFNNMNHPIIFINTSNHAMAEHDGNRFLWKWEYLPWEESSPVKLGNLPRCAIDKRFTPSKIMPVWDYIAGWMLTAKCIWFKLNPK